MGSKKNSRIRPVYSVQFNIVKGDDEVSIQIKPGSSRQLSSIISDDIKEEMEGRWVSGRNEIIRTREGVYLVNGVLAHQILNQNLEDFFHASLGTKYKIIKKNDAEYTREN